MTSQILPATVVGSYPQPDWLIDREMLKTMVPRVRYPELWRVPADLLQAAQDDATLLAVRDMERAGMDVVTDGEIRRESYSNQFISALEGIDLENPAVIKGRSGNEIQVPRVVGKIRRRDAVEVRNTEFLRRNTDRRIKMTLPGPFTMSRQAVNEYYDDEEELALDLAAAVNEEAKAVKAAGADVIQLDEPWMQAQPEAAGRYAIKAINRALDGVAATTIVHMCFGYAQMVKDKPSGYSFLPQLADAKADQISIEAAQPHLDLGVLEDLAGKSILLGVLDLSSSEVETAETVAERIRAGLAHVPDDRLVPAPDCGMKYLDRDVAFGKLKALADGAALVRSEVS
jgi:5-methyltetrahydropteroyltriglutamate--homocysteine methyltransferase